MLVVEASCKRMLTPDSGCEGEMKVLQGVRVVGSKERKTQRTILADRMTRIGKR
jgi:hypothetical protein